MGLDAKQFYEHVICPTLDCMGRIIDIRMSSLKSKKLLLGTSCSESQLTYVKQFNGGCALGLYQMEPATYNDICNWLEKHKGTDFKNKVIYCIYEEMYRDLPDATQLVYNLRLQTIFARLHYWRVSDPIPKATPLQAQYWKTFYNTALGRGTVQHYINSFPDLS
jgi:hypothetical protein